MARIRTIKPEFWTSEQVVECSPTARLLFIGLWNFCDDHGNHPASLKTLKMEVFPGDCITPVEVGRLIMELQQHELIAEYEAEGKRYWHVSGWYHQKVEKPNKKYPPFDPGCIIPLRYQEFDDHSPTPPRTLPDHPPEDVEGSLRESSLEGKNLKNKECPESLNFCQRSIVECLSKKGDDFKALFKITDDELQIEKMTMLEYYRTHTFGSGAEFFAVKRWLEKYKERKDVRRDSGSTKAVGGKKSGITEANPPDADWLGTGTGS